MNNSFMNISNPTLSEYFNLSYARHQTGLNRKTFCLQWDVDRRQWRLKQWNHFRYILSQAYSINRSMVENWYVVQVDLIFLGQHCYQLSSYFILRTWSEFILTLTESQVSLPHRIQSLETPPSEKKLQQVRTTLKGSWMMSKS